MHRMYIFLFNQVICKVKQQHKQSGRSNLYNSQQKEPKYNDKNQQAQNSQIAITNRDKNDSQRQIELLNNSSQEIYNHWQIACCKFKYDLKQLKKKNQDRYSDVLLFENIQFYHCQRNIKTPASQPQKVNLYEVEGSLYLTEYDGDFNPKYIHQEGSFLINLEQRTFYLNGEGVEFSGKSKFIKHQGKFKNGEFIPEQQNKINNKKENQPSKKYNQKIIIKDATTGQQINKQQQNRNQQNYMQDIWCKYNQTLSNNDLNILKNKGWMTSSIIDSYVLYLNCLSEQQYFKLQEVERSKVQRILFLPSSLTTNFGKNFTNNKARDLLEQELLQYSQMNLSIQLIYKKVGFPINKNNFHWYFLLFEFDTKVEIFDSTENSNDISNHAEMLIKTLQQVLQMKCKTKVQSKESGQQSNGYSCGYHVCNFMRFVQQAQFSKNNNRYVYKENEIIQILTELIDKQTK